MTCVACTGSSIPSTTFCGECGGRVGIDSVDHLIGATLDGRYVIDSKIAAGGFGTVYRGRSIASGQRVAIKVLLAQHTNDPSVSARFRREAVAMSSLASRHTVTTYELGEDLARGAQFIAMELLEGESLYDRFIACGSLHWRTVLSIVRQVCESLAEAHALGIVHRDLKPANIFLSQHPVGDYVKVLDFGIAKILQGSNMHDGTDLTRIGQAIGTLEYMSPEQLIGGELDNRTDIYTLGVVAYEMIVGNRPFADVTGATGLVTALMTRRPPLPSQLTRGPLPAALDSVLLRCLERDAQDRYGDVHELAAAIDQMLATKEDLFTTQRQWRHAPIFDVDQEDELTQVDAKPLFDTTKPAGKAPVDGRAGLVELPSERDPHALAAIRAQFCDPCNDAMALAPRTWRAQGTGVPFAETSELEAFDSRTGAQPLYATQWAVGTEAMAEPPTRLAIGSSPLIEERPTISGGTDVELPEARQLRALELVAWAIGLVATGLGLGAAIATLAG
jgi:serine/threonine protein kinase